MIEAVEYEKRYYDFANKQPFAIQMSILAGIHAKCFEYTRAGKNPVLDAVLANGVTAAHDAAIIKNAAVLGFGPSQRLDNDTIVIFSGGTSVVVSEKDPEHTSCKLHCYPYGEWNNPPPTRPDGKTVTIWKGKTYRTLRDYAITLGDRLEKRVPITITSSVLAMEHAKVYLQQSSYPEPVGRAIRQAYVKLWCGELDFDGVSVEVHCVHQRLHGMWYDGKRWDNRPEPYPPIVITHPDKVSNIASLDINDWEGASYETRCIEGMRFDYLLPFVSAVVLPNGDIWRYDEDGVFGLSNRIEKSASRRK